MIKELERYREVNDILETALELPPADIHDFLSKACADDQDLRGRVERLLRHQEAMDGFLDEPIFMRPLPGADAGDRVGSYELTTLLGRGGMGSVYLGRRVEGGFEQEVAVKILKRGLDTDEIVRRFRREQQLLARLSHPYVARLLDGGAHNDGRPYLVMEYVEGVPIDTYCDQANLGVSERLRLFLKVCDAVRFAHGNLIVHRDLKPENVLVSEDGTPKLLDFGIAKLLEEDPRFTASSVSSRYGGMGTLRYASPEQLRGEPVTVTADVYALGVMLYELLTSERPYQLDGLAPIKAMEVVWRQTPPLPSAVIQQPPFADARMLRKALSGNLDAIVGKALAKNPNDRFASVDALVDDIERHLDGRLVRSRPTTAAIRAREFLRRNAAVLAVAATIVTVVVAFALVVLFKNWEIEARNVELQSEKERVETVLSVLEDILTTTDPARAKGDDVTVREALRIGLDNLDGDQMASEPELHAKLLDTVGRVYGRLGLHSDALPLLEKALLLRKKTLGTKHRLYAASLANLANAENELRHRKEAVELMRQAVPVFKRNFPEGSAGFSFALANLASYLPPQDPEAERLALEALAMQRRILGHKAGRVAVTQNVLATIYRATDRPDEAEAAYRECIAIWRQDEKLVDLATALNNLAALLADIGEPDDLREARALHEEALAIRRQLYNGDHARLMSSLNNLGVLLTSVGELRESLSLLNEAHEMARRLFPEESTNTNTMTVQKNIAAARLALGEYEACESLARAAADALKSGKSFQEAQSILGGCLEGLGRAEEAAPLLESSSEALADQPGRAAREAARRWAEFQVKRATS